MAAGFTLADIPDRVTWRALRSMLLNPWSPGDHLSALVVDVGQLLLWTKAPAGTPRPDPIPRPGDERRKAAETAAIIAAAEAAGLTRREAVTDVG